VLRSESVQRISPPGGGEVLAIARSGLPSLEEAIGRPGTSALTLQSAARAFVDALVALAPVTTVLARVLVTQPFRDLPPEEHAFVDRLAKARGVRGQLRPDTPVLALLATRGMSPAWNDVRGSVAHRAVPLTGPAFVRTIPMVGRMLEDLGYPVETLASDEEREVRPRLAEGMGVFHVRDAADPANGAVIPSREFVVEHGVRSVFGLGTAYVEGSVLVVLVFSRDLVDRETVVSLAPLAATLKRRTYPAVAAGRIFDTDGSGVLRRFDVTR
jgi:hypothetical protein